MDGTEYSEKACYEKAVSLDPELAVAWSNLGLAGGGPEGGREGVGAVRGASGGLSVEGPRGLFQGCAGR